MALHQYVEQTFACLSAAQMPYDSSTSDKRSPPPHPFLVMIWVAAQFPTAKSNVR